MIGVAAESGRILVADDTKTIPAHFARFRQARSGSGIIIVSQDLDIGTAIEDLLLIWAVTEAGEWRNHLGFVPV